MERSRRAAPMAPPERRAAIIEATVPLLRTRGWAVTTREIATASGVAEGTIFSVFDDKETLLIAAVGSALDPAPTAARLSQIDRSLPLEDRLIMAVTILGERLAETWQLMAALHLWGSEEVRRQLPDHTSGDYFADVIAQLFDPSQDDLALDPAVAGKALVALSMLGANSRVFRTPLSAAEIVALVLDGMRSDPSR